VLRALLISGASAHLRQQKARGVTDPWLRDLLARRPYKVAMVAFAPVGRSKSPGYGHLKLPHLMIAVSAAEQQ
jgi:hypothetical protein